MATVYTKHFHRASSCAPLLTMAYSIHLLLILSSDAEANEWTLQFDPATGYGTDVAADIRGNVFVATVTNELLPDAFIKNYDSDGQLLWETRLGAQPLDRSDALMRIATDGLGNLYAAGATTGNYAGTSAGREDLFLTKFNELGQLLWSRQWGTTDRDAFPAVYADSFGNTYVSASTLGTLGSARFGASDIAITKFDATGQQQWTRQVGTPFDDYSRGIASDQAGNVYFASTANDSASRTTTTMSLNKLGADGQILWTKSIGEGAYGGTGTTDLAIDTSGNIFVSGVVSPIPSGPTQDPFVAKYDSSGNMLWTKVFGSSAQDLAWNLATDNHDNVYVTGYSRGGIGGPVLGEADAFAVKFDAQGDLIWKRPIGNAAFEQGWGIAADNLGHIYVTGQSIDNGPRTGFLARLDDDHTCENVLQGALKVEWNEGTIRFDFIPNFGYTVDETARTCNCDAFNFVQTFTDRIQNARLWHMRSPEGTWSNVNPSVIDGNGIVYADTGTELIPATPISGPQIDPIVDGVHNMYAVSYIVDGEYHVQPIQQPWGDSLPYIYNLTSGENHSLESNISPDRRVLTFVDIPSTGFEVLAPGDHIQFLTQLVGITEDGPVSWSGLGTNVAWKTNRAHVSSPPQGGIYDVFYLITSEDEAPPILSGGVFDVVIDPVMVPEPSQISLLLSALTASGLWRLSRKKLQIAMLHRNSDS